MAEELQRKHPGFTPSCIADIANQTHGAVDADLVLTEMEREQTRQKQQSPTARQTQKPKDAVPKEARHAPTAQELNEVREKYEQAAKRLEGLIDQAFEAQHSIPSPLPSPSASTVATTTTVASTGANKGPEIPFVTAKLSQTEKNSIEYEFSCPSPTSTDWIAVFIHDRQLSHSGYEYTRGMAHGTGIFRGLCEGTFDVRLLRGRDSEHYIARSAPVLIGSSVDLSVSGVAEEKLNVRYSVGTKSDWIGLFVQGTRSNKQYLAYSYVTAGNNGTVHFDTPRTPGMYEVRYFRANSGYAYSSCLSFEVPNSDKIEATMMDNKMCRVVWKCHTRQRTSGDWVGIFEPTATSKQYLNSVYVSHGQVDGNGDSGMVLLDVSKINPGTYSIRFFSPKSEETGLRTTFIISSH